jgi:hypothetical protein
MSSKLAAQSRSIDVQDSAPAYTVLLIETVADFEALQEPWNSFISDSETRNLALTHAFLLAWLRHFPPCKLKIIVVQDAAGNWVSVAPFQISAGRTGYSQRLLQHLQWVGTQPTIFDWIRLPVHPQADEQAVLTLIAKTMLQWRWDLLDLFFNPDHDQLSGLLQRLQPQASADEAIVETMPIPWLDLPLPEAEFLKTRRKKTRLELNRFTNRIVNQTGLKPELAYQGSTADQWPQTRAMLKHFAQGHAAYWGAKGVKSDFIRYAALEDFYADLLLAAENASPDSPALKLSTLDLQGKPMCYQLGFWQGTHYLSHMTHYEESYQDYSPGTLHMEALVIDTIRRGGTHFDFGRGEQPYKRLWTKVNRPLWNLRLFRTPLAKAIWNVDATLKRLTGKASI